MTHFMISDNSFFLFRNNSAFLLLSISTLTKMPEYIHLHKSTIVFRCEICSASFTKFSKSFTRKSAVVCCLLQIYIIIMAYSLYEPEEFLHVLSRLVFPHKLYTVKTSRSQNCWIQNICLVRCSHNDDSLIDSKTIHFNKHFDLMSVLFSSCPHLNQFHVFLPASISSINTIQGAFSLISLLRGKHPHLRTFQNQNQKY